MEHNYKLQIYEQWNSSSSSNFLKKLSRQLLLAALLLVCQLSTIGQTIQNDVFWKDTNGNPIYSQGGGVLKVGNTYYWYGAKYNGAITYFNNPYSGKNGDIGFLGITCYSSTDLVNWTNRGDVLSPGDIPQSIGWLGRVGIAYNPTSKQYVLISQLNSGILFATNSSPTGKFTFRHTQETITNVVNEMSGDQSVFTDDNGQAYLIYCNRQGRSHQYVSKLRSSDYLYVEPATNIYRASSGREGNVMFKRNGTYYFLTSDLHGWNTSRTYVVTATNILGPYSSEFVMQGSQNDYSHVTQSGLAVQVNGTSGSFVIFGGDRWANFAGNGVGYNQWVPITFNGTTPVFNSLSQWNINAAAGTWSVGSGNNYILNPNFEADRIDVAAVTGWTNWITSGTNPNGNVQGSHNPGRFSLEQYSTAAYEAGMYQGISLPNGTYTLKAWVKSSGGQSIARVYVKNYGGSQRNYSINQSISAWTEISIPDIIVTNGAIEVGVHSNAGGGQWLNVDDFSLIRAGATTPATYTTFRNRGTALQIDGMGRTTNGSNAGQNAASTGNSQQWLIETVGSYVKLKNRATGLYLDGMGLTANGSICGQYAGGTSTNQQWTIETAGSYSKLRNRATGLYIDGMGRTTNGSDLGQYASGSSYNQQWTMSAVSGAALANTQIKEMSLSLNEENTAVVVYPNPTTDVVTITLPDSYKDDEKLVDVLDGSGKLVLSEKFRGTGHTLNLSSLPQGIYVLRVQNNQQLIVKKVIKK